MVKVQKVSYVKMITDLYSRCNVSNLFNYHKGNITQAPLEALLTYYTAQSVVLLTGTFIRPDTDLVTALRYIIVPLIIGVVVCTLFLILASCSITKKLYYSLLEYEKQSGIELYKSIDKKLKGTFIYCQIGGILAYLIVAGVASSYYSISGYFIDSTLGIFVCVGIGFISGVIWNTLGYYGNRLIDWRKIVKPLASMKIETNDNFKKEKFKYFMVHIIINSSMVLIMLIIQCISLAFNNNKEFDSNLVSLIIPLTIAIITLYCKLVYVQYYFGQKRKSVYLRINDLFKQ